MTIAFKWEKIREEQPLIHHITNYVTVTDCANITLACGASPVMAHAPEEVSEMVAHSQALVLNIGTLSQSLIESMIRAAKTANQKQVPIVLDPVGVGATTFRLQTVQELLRQVQFTVIRGNASEIATLCGFREGKGVDAIDTELKQFIPQVRKLAKQLQTVIAVSGEVDYITDGTQEAQITNGTELLTKVTGTGCMTTALIGCCLGAGIPPFTSAITSLLVMGLVGEWAEGLVEADNVGSFRTYLFDGFAKMNNQWLQKKGKVYVTAG
ncbi:hydroxyethylthiazole kinase [Shimazuella alba]|uniref:Hydroxyethylthiazole kinase n=1 Tax=Shimazuella alba TaxID=2690964 RepID=A0A6I4VU14_9BACL|nr:hydroxyethylthiazole kinase [Shimazuella alba]MXQ53360.1 hydroxyethylthiazole kinase [Shimazuella alba]